jgi:hypothetical protein
MTNSLCKNFHWIGDTLMAEEFGEAVELCNVEWSSLDEFEAEHKRLIAAAPDLLEACLEFVRKCESGEAKSKRSYAQMTAAIAKARGQS